MCETKKAYKSLNEYLLSHEDDIATEQEDFGILNPMFTLIIGRKALSMNERLIQKELAENMTHPSYVIENIFNIKLSPEEKLRADNWRINKLELETGSAS
jgi:hypothetical protein